MNLLDKAQLLAHIVHWRLTWSRRDLDYREPGVSHPKFVTAREAVAQLPDGACCFSCGMAANHRNSIFFWAVRERFEKEGHPARLTWITVGAQGSRGRAPGTIEELNLPGLLERHIGGHLETARALLKLADEGKLELHTLPQGIMTFLLEAQARGEDHVLSPVGKGTFLDPRVGTGSAVTPGATTQLVTAAGDQLRYTLPKLDFAFLVAPYADAEGNIYFEHGSTLTESRESALAARACGGRVLVTVAAIRPKDPAKIFLRADQVDLIVVNPLNEQTGAVKQRAYWPMFTAGGGADLTESVARLKFINNFLKITPVRGPLESALARLAASRVIQLVKRGAHLNVGVGLPEEVSRLVYEGGLLRDVTFTTETGNYGGLPAPGIFFGASVNPQKLMSSAEMFHLYEKSLDLTLLGFLQVDREGNVNVSKRGPKPSQYVGPGGFPDISTYARNVVFVGTWMANAEVSLENGQPKVIKPGPLKFMEKVDEITFSGKEALARGQQVYYATTVGLFRLTEGGLELLEVMPGVDVKKDILEVCPFPILLPAGEVKRVPAHVASGEGFQLKWD